MANDKKTGQEHGSDFMDLKHLATTLEKGMSLNNLAQSISQNLNAQTTGQGNENAASGDGKKE
jgi:hypothetical protein